MKNEQKAVKSQFRIRDGKSAQLFCAASFEQKTDEQWELDSLLRHPKKMNMPCVFILDSDKNHRNKVVDEWILRNKIGVNQALNQTYLLNESGEKYMAVDVSIGAETTLLKSLQRMVLCYPENLQCPSKTKRDCQDAIVYPLKIWAEYHPIFVIRDIENILSIKRKKDREMFAIILKHYYNDLHCSFVFTGTIEGAHALNITEQFGWRFLDNVLDFDYGKRIP